MNKFDNWLHNALHFHERVMMRYLRKRGWIVFYLEEHSRECNGDICWMKEYCRGIPNLPYQSVNKVVSEKGSGSEHRSNS
jgi:hypothetical protein